jgi:hypothetical protein
MFDSLRKFEVQARYAAVLALVSLAPCAAAFVLSWKRFDMTLGRIVYGGQGRFVMAFAGCVLLSLAPSAVALILGVNSAGQKRNERSSQSWLGFFIGGGVLTLNLILLIAFYMLRLKV